MLSEQVGTDDMRRNGKQKVVYYTSFDQDMVESRDQEHQVPENYDWSRRSIGRRILDTFIYVIALIFSAVYCPLVLHVRVKNRHCLKGFHRKGFFLYGNHTQMVGDAFIPAWACLGTRIYVVVSPANLGIPILGKLLPSLGALPIPPEVGRMRAFNQAIDEKIAVGKCVVVYPEAHVWPYYTGIRPYPDTSFHYPVRCEVPAFAMTTTYQKRRFGTKPRITVWLDGPFYPEEGASPKQQRKQLHEQVQAGMEKYSAYSDYEYIKYRAARNEQEELTLNRKS